jgi:Yip1 domain
MTDLTPTAVQAEAAPKGVFSRIVGVIFSPRATFAEVAARPRSLGVLVICMAIIILALFALFKTEVGQQAWIDQQVRGAESFGRPINDQQLQGMERIAPYVGYIVAVGYLIVIPIVIAIMSGILLGVFNALMGGDASFKQVFAVVVHAGVITTLQTVLVMPVDYFNKSLSSPTTLGAFASFLDESSFVARLLSSIDIFYIWWLVVLAIGLGVLYRRRTGPIATTFLALYGGIALAIAAIRSALS